MKAVFLSVSRKITHVLATCIIIIATLICVSYFLTPVVQKYRPDMERMASQLLGTPVSIGQVELSWYQYQPVINLNAVTILNNKTNEPALQIQKVRLFISLFQTMWTFKPAANGILISGSEVVIHSDKAGNVTVQGFPAFGTKNVPYKSETGIKQIAGWLAEQPRLILQDIDIRYTGINNLQRYVSLQNLSFINSGRNHTIAGGAVLHQELPTIVNTTINWTGDPNDLATINANVYLYASGLSLSQWFKDLNWQGWQLKGGVGSSKIWFDWKNNTIQKFQTIFQLYDLELYSLTDKSKQVINRLSGNVGVRRSGKDGKQIEIDGDEILIDLPSHLWPMTSFNVTLLQDDQGNINPLSTKIGYVDLNDLQTFLNASPHKLPYVFYSLLPKLNISGSVQNFAVNFSEPDWQNWQGLAVSGDLRQFSNTPYQQYPGIENLNASFTWRNNKGSVEFKDNSHLKLNYDSIFANAVSLSQLTGTVSFSQDDKNQWTWNANNLHLQNNDLQADVKANVMTSANQSPQIDLTSNFSVQNARNITLYLPMKVFEKGLVDWLQHAFSAGSIKSGVAILKGKLADFPFESGNGIFSITADVKDVNLKYASDWPKIKNIDGKVAFLGSQLLIDVSQGETLDIPINHVHAEIPTLTGANPTILQVTANEIATDLNKAMHYVVKSPLDAKIGRMFRNTELSGPAALKLQLTVPLKDTDKTQVTGNLALKNAVMNIKLAQLIIKNITGDVQFTENDTTATNITGLIFNKPITFDFATKNSIVNANFKTNLAVADLESWLNISLAKFMQGSTNISGNVLLSLDKPVVVNLTSDLQGMALNLPYHYGKKAEETKNVLSTITIQEKQPIKMIVNYGKDLGAALLLNKTNEEYKVQAINLLLGEGTPHMPPGAGLFLSGNFDRLDWDTIKAYTEKATENEEMPLSLPLHGINVHANTLILGGLSIKDVDLQIAKEDKNWQVNINSKDVSGKVTVPHVLSNKGTIVANFDKLHLNSAEAAGESKSKGKPSFSTKSLPSIKLNANSFSFGSVYFGSVLFDAEATGSGLDITAFNIQSDYMMLQSSGEWSSGNETRLRGSVTSSNVSALLNSFGINVSNYNINDGRASFDLGWHDAPFAPSLAALNGSLRLDIGHGRILDIGESNNTKMDIGRMLSIFSLANLPRRLSLNFSDLFERGYSFDYVRGDFTFKNGNAFTQNLTINGPVVSVNIDGRIGLGEKIYDLTMSITPHDVGSSIPVAATIITANPLVGLAALGVNSVLSASISHAATYYYSVTGPWSNPTWQQVSK